MASIKASVMGGIFALASSSIAFGHEFWMETNPAQPASGNLVSVSLFVGSDLQGEPYPNLPHTQRAVDLEFNGERFGLESRAGDLPAFRFNAQGSGLLVLRYQSVENDLVYDDYNTFLKFIKQAGRPELAAVNDEKGFPKDAIKENFTRFAKTLIAIDGGKGSDVSFGMPFELVALDNPYTEDDGGVTYQLLKDGAVAANAATYVYHRDREGMIERLDLKTDSNGTFEVPIDEAGFFLVAAVDIELEDRPEFLSSGYMWKSSWASSTFELDD